MAGETEVTDNINDLVEELNEESEEETVVNPPEEEEEEENEEEEEEETPTDDKSKEKSDREIKVAIPNYKEVTKKYPNLFKDFPDFRHIFFHAKEYRELFPTLDDARAALDELEVFKDMEKSLTDGSQEDTTKFLSSVKELGEEAISNLANNFLPSIKKMDQELYFQVITPELVSITRSMFDSGLRNENENLKNAALVLSMHLFGDQDVASGKKNVNTPERAVKKDDKLERERQNFRQERYTSLYNDIVSESDTKLQGMISDGMDPNNKMTAGMKELVVEKVIKEIGQVLSNDKIHTSRMNNLWKKAGETNFSTSNKSKIISAYLEAAEEIMPRIRAKVRANILGIRERRSETKPGERTERIEPKSTTGGGRSSSNGKNVDSKQVDWKKTSDIDFLRDNITLRK